MIDPTKINLIYIMASIITVLSTVLVFVFRAVINGGLVPRRIHEATEVERDYWRETALEALELSRTVRPIVKAVANAMEESVQETQAKSDGS